MWLGIIGWFVRILLGLGMIAIGALLAIFMYSNLPKMASEIWYFGTIIPLPAGIALAILFVWDPMHEIIKGGEIPNSEPPTEQSSSPN
jgi:hypothetical protein